MLFFVLELDTINLCHWIFFQVVSPALQQLKAILVALDLPQPTKESTVFELFSQIETKVSKSYGLVINTNRQRSVF